MDIIASEQPIHIGNDIKKKLSAIISRDCKFLEENGLMDYSILIVEVPKTDNTSSSDSLHVPCGEDHICSPSTPSVRHVCDLFLLGRNMLSLIRKHISFLFHCDDDTDIIDTSQQKQQKLQVDCELRDYKAAMYTLEEDR